MPDGEPEALPEMLQAALREAYPDPKGRIAEAVMARIREERAAEKAQLRRRTQGLVMKWGGMAACMMILCGALVLAAPLMNRAEEVAVQDAAVMTLEAETVPETMLASGVLADQVPAEAYAADADMPAEDGAVEAEAEEAVAMTKTAPVKQGAEETEAPVMMFAARPTVTTDAAEEGLCYDGSNESLLQLLLAEGALTEADYLAWMDGKGYTSGADWTVEELCEAFGLDASLWLESAAE